MIVESDFLNRKITLSHSYIFLEKCLPAVASRLLGFAITFGSAFLFVPQILKIHSARSGAGISLLSQLLALLSAGAICAYSYEKKFVFSQWGDSLAVFIQITIIIMQVVLIRIYSYGALDIILYSSVVIVHVRFYGVYLDALYGSYLSLHSLLHYSSPSNCRYSANYSFKSKRIF